MGTGWCARLDVLDIALVEILVNSFMRMHLDKPACIGDASVSWYPCCTTAANAKAISKTALQVSRTNLRRHTKWPAFAYKYIITYIRILPSCIMVQWMHATTLQVNLCFMLLHRSILLYTPAAMSLCIQAFLVMHVLGLMSRSLRNLSAVPEFFIVHEIDESAKHSEENDDSNDYR